MTWLLEQDPRLIQGILTFFAALVAATTAWGIALVVYPIQRNKDRRHEVLAERRRAYARFLEAVNGVYTAALGGDAKKMQETQFELHSVASQFICYASPSTVLRARSLVEAVQEFRTQVLTNMGKKWEGEEQEDLSESKNNFSNARAEAIAAIRADLFDGSPEVAEEVIRPFFPSLSQKQEEEK